MFELILVKLGGSVITDKSKPFTEDINTIKRLAKEIHEAREEKKFKLIIGHGGGSYPHTYAEIFRTNEGVMNKRSYEGIAKVQDAASILNRIIVNQLINAGENAVSINPSSCTIAENGTIKRMFLEPIEKLLDFDMVPVPYGDVCLDSKKGCCILSTEGILSYLAKEFNKDKKYKVSRVLLCGRVGGVFNDNPDENPDAELIPIITQKNIKKIESVLKGSSGIDVTGGMMHKVKMMLELTELGIESEVINVKKSGILKRALLGEKGLGTIIRKD
ncbi:MAG: isopentenyl phosphate kinase [Candidatus Aenigmarchaeota archaeon]|nr:isopentenyl phosphate kinase [Candidatus Aenigmarchaeota archaeon]